MCLLWGGQCPSQKSLSNKFMANENSTYLSGETNCMPRKGTQIEENAFISSDEIVLMQTATTEIRNSNNSWSAGIRLLLDSGSQRTYITETLAKKLSLKGENE